MSERISTQLTEMSELAGGKVAEMSELFGVKITWIDSDISVSFHATLLSGKLTLATVCNFSPLLQLTEMSELPGGRDVRTSMHVVGADLQPLASSDISAIRAGECYHPKKGQLWFVRV